MFNNSVVFELFFKSFKLVGIKKKIRYIIEKKIDTMKFVSRKIQFKVKNKLISPSYTTQKSDVRKYLHFFFKFKLKIKFKLFYFN